MKLFPFAPEIRGQVRRTFFGTDACRSRFLLTPVPAIFRAFVGDAPTRGGWFRSAATPFGDAVLLPQASAVIDGLAALDAGTDVVLMGLGGSLADARPGDIVEVSSARWDGVDYSRTAEGPFWFPAAALEQVSCLAESYGRGPAGFAGVTCVDMESGYLFAAARAFRLRARSLLVISDRIPDRPFYAPEAGLDGEAHIGRLVAGVRSSLGPAA